MRMDRKDEIKAIIKAENEEILEIDEEDN